MYVYIYTYYINMCIYIRYIYIYTPFIFGWTVDFWSVDDCCCFYLFTGTIDHVTALSVLQCAVKLCVVACLRSYLNLSNWPGSPSHWPLWPQKLAVTWHAVFALHRAYDSDFSGRKTVELRVRLTSVGTYVASCKAKKPHQILLA